MHCLQPITRPSEILRKSLVNGKKVAIVEDLAKFCEKVSLKGLSHLQKNEVGIAKMCIEII